MNNFDLNYYLYNDFIYEPNITNTYIRLDLCPLVEKHIVDNYKDYIIYTDGIEPYNSYLAKIENKNYYLA